MASSCPIAVVGMAALFPGAPDLDTYWHNLVHGIDAITEVPAARWDAHHYAPDAEPRADRVYCRRGGFVDDLADIDVTAFGIMPASVRATEPDQLIALRVAAQAVQDAGGTDRLLPDRRRAGVILGRGGYLTPGLVRLDQRVRTASQLVRTLQELLPHLGADQLDEVRRAFTEQLGPEAPESAIGLVPNLAASRLANRLDLRGPAYTVDAACASSLIAVDHAVRELDSGRCDVMLAGGVHHCHDITLWSVFSQLGALSRSERIRPFHRDADGVLIGEGTGIVVLKRLADAERDGDRIYAVVTGTGVAGDGRTGSLLSPDSAGQAEAIRQAWRQAGRDPSEPGALGLLEAHGTATPAGDTAELETVRAVFGPPGDTPRAVIGSVKSMIGHTMPAAGIAGLIKAALAVHHGVLPPTLHCDDPHPALARTRFTTVDSAVPWESDVHGPLRRAAVNAFGFGGINAHVVLEQPHAAAVSATSGHAGPAAVVREPERVLRLAATSPGELARLLDQEDTALRATATDTPLPGPAGPVRLGVVDPTAKRLALARKAVDRGRAWRGRNDVWFVPEPLLGAAGGRLAFVFPGLEAEFGPNCDDIARHFGLPWSPSGTDATVGDIGRQGTGVFQLGRLLYSALERMDVVPDALAGHSLGEWTAMAAAGIHAQDEVDAFLADFDPDALRVPGVVFAVIGAPASRVDEALREQTQVVLSHDNAPNQSMICGPSAAVEEFVERFREQGAISQILPFRSGFHTPMLRPYLDPIRKAAETYTLHPPSLPVWSATTLREYPSHPQAVRDLFTRHLLEPVRFRPLIDAMYEAGFRAFVQLGAGQVGSLIGDTLRGRDHLVVPAHSMHRSGLPQLRRVATALWAEGARPDLTALRPTATPARTTAYRPVRLDLGGALISLNKETRAGVGAALVPPRRAADGARFAALDELGTRNPLAAEFAALLDDTAALAADVLASGRRGAHRAIEHVPPTRPTPPPAPELHTSLRISVDTMPYLLDHCFFKQPPQADVADRWPVVPGTTVIGHLMDFAERAAPGLRAVAVHDVRLNRWITAVPETDIPVDITPLPPHPSGASRVTAALASYAQAVVELAVDHDPHPPAPWTFPDDEERPCDLAARELYTRRWMFHGPRFQGVSELTAIGDAHVRGVLTTPPAPGALLDNVGQLLGYWIMSQLPTRTTVFPVGMREIRFHGPHPAPGERLDCLIRIVSVTDATLEADMQLVHRGRVWAEFSGWRDRRFDNDPKIRRVDREPEHHTLSEAQPGGWALVHERWPDLATRDLIMRNMLAGEERAAYETHTPRGRRQWLLGRIAVKDAVRQRLWNAASGGVFPSELRVANDRLGRPYITGAYGRTLPDLTVSLAHRAEAAVAIARPGPCGIDIEEVSERPNETLEAALGARERDLLASLVRETGEPEALWFTRFWAAKEAVGKARGTGLAGAPKRFEITAATGTALTVRTGGDTHHVRHRTVRNPPGLPDREYVVGWTATHDEESDDDH
ncbi:polyketide synthase dehydratase domain-containing protein [Streptomyces sp. NBC_01005]|uniref:beta-ketoacyl synthase N-terminal-like domain-containing protein n=1 Tax=unclassified Streptomyces TaxID=2593676 RepID=UPI003867BDBE|nr:polyketide synthase dehydratase domain-containing protein [Streptomyces sp. NBC_01005]WTC99683.1 polyketide synthase dehydratase domain-containing protein [Streptomyces sp. NBC_01650]